MLAFRRKCRENENQTGLGIKNAFCPNLSSYKFSAFYRNKRKNRIVGGQEHQAVTNFLIYMKSLLKKNISRVFLRAPITGIQMILGLGLSAASSIGVIHLSPLLYHTRLVFDHGEFLRLPTSFIVLSTSFFGMIRSCIGLYYYQVPFEEHFTKGLSNIPGSYPVSPKNYFEDDEKRNVFRMGCINQDFIHILLVLASSIVVEELLFSSDSFISKSGPFIHVYPYTLYPIFEQGMRWTWAMIADDSYSYSLFNGLIVLEPIHIPLLLLVMDGFDGGFDCVKGLLAACFTCHTLSVKRHDGGNAVDYLKYVAVRLFKWFRALF